MPGGNHTVLVRSDGAALAFGHNGAGQCEIPELPEAREHKHLRTTDGVGPKFLDAPIR